MRGRAPPPRLALKRSAPRRARSSARGGEGPLERDLLVEQHADQQGEGVVDAGGASASGSPVTGNETGATTVGPAPVDFGCQSPAAACSTRPGRPEGVDVELGEGGHGPVLLVGLVAEHQPEEGAAVDHGPERVGGVARVDLGPGEALRLPALDLLLLAFDPVAPGGEADVAQLGVVHRHLLEHAHEAGVALVGPQVAAVHALNSGPRVVAAAGQGTGLGPDLGDERLDHLDEQVALGLEVRVEGAVRDLGDGRDVGDGRLGVAVLGEHPPGRLHEGRPGPPATLGHRLRRGGAVRRAVATGRRRRRRRRRRGLGHRRDPSGWEAGGEGRDLFRGAFHRDGVLAVQAGRCRN